MFNWNKLIHESEGIMDNVGKYLQFTWKSAYLESNLFCCWFGFFFNYMTRNKCFLRVQFFLFMEVGFSQIQKGIFPERIPVTACQKRTSCQLFFSFSTLAPKIDCDELCMKYGHRALSLAKYLCHLTVQLGWYHIKFWIPKQLFHSNQSEVIISLSAIFNEPWIWQGWASWMILIDANRKTEGKNKCWLVHCTSLKLRTRLLRQQEKLREKKYYKY